jgi:hypothetical protein
VEDNTCVLNFINEQTKKKKKKKTSTGEKGKHGRWRITIIKDREC